jgi:hypothetical protein
MKKILFILLLVAFSCGTESRVPAGTGGEDEKPESPVIEENSGGCEVVVKIPEGLIYVECNDVAGWLEIIIPLPPCDAPSCDIPDCPECICEPCEECICEPIECEPCECEPCICEEEDEEEIDCIEICHIPPGNPGNMHTICVEEPAVYHHLDHGDYFGPCRESDD